MSDSFKESDLQHYLDIGGVNCPFCGGTDMGADSMQVDSGSAYQTVSCNKCDRSWTDYHTLDQIGGIHNEDGDTVKGLETYEDNYYGPDYKQIVQQLLASESVPALLGLSSELDKLIETQVK